MEDWEAVEAKMVLVEMGTSMLCVICRSRAQYPGWNNVGWVAGRTPYMISAC